MSIRYGSGALGNKLYVGTTEANKAYLGTTLLVEPQTQPSLPLRSSPQLARFRENLLSRPTANGMIGTTSFTPDAPAITTMNGQPFTFEDMTIQGIRLHRINTNRTFIRYTGTNRLAGKFLRIYRSTTDGAVSDWFQLNMNYYSTMASDQRNTASFISDAIWSDSANTISSGRAAVVQSILDNSINPISNQSTHFVVVEVRDQA